MAEDFGAVEMCRLAEYNQYGIETRKVDLTEQNRIWQHPWMLVHRVRLHDRLKLVATGTDGPGRPAELHLSSKVVEVDTETATLVLERGERVQADLIIGADGIYVCLLEKISQQSLTHFSRKQESACLELQVNFLAQAKPHFDF